MLATVLVANRGEIAVRIVRACRAAGSRAAIVHSTPDTGALATRLADVAVELPGSSSAETYLDVEAVLRAARAAGADAIHPGYGFLAENAEFADAVMAEGMVWIGPPPEAIRLMGDKVTARATAQRAGVAGVPGTTEAVEAVGEVADFADEHGYPVVIKASAGGGGRGMRVVRAPAEAAEALPAARREAGASFGDDRVYVERYLEWPRHVEVQVLADRHGSCVAVGDRDCSVQRRHQKLIEEAPAPGLSDEVRAGLAAASEDVSREVGYVGAGTVEFLVEDGRYYFLEMNTRLQVEHPVTEVTCGLDLVLQQLRVAAGEPLDLGDVGARGHAIECRINAEDPAGGRFLPQSGTITRLDPPQGPGIRFDAGYAAGDEIPAFYDNLVGKLVVWGSDREAARLSMIDALRELRVEGVAVTAEAQASILEHPDFAAVRHATPWLEAGVVELPEAPPPSPDLVDGSSTDGDELWVQNRRYWLAPPLAAEVAGAPSRAGARRPRHPQSGERRSPRAAAGGPAGGAITAPMQGTVIKIAVAVGETVEAGKTLLVLEAMKMENEITAQRGGVVAELSVGEGQAVGPGDVLIVIEDELA